MKKKEPEGLSTEERSSKLIAALRHHAQDLCVGTDGVFNVEIPGITHTELATIAIVAYVSGAITGARLREEMGEAFLRQPDEWQRLIDFGLACWAIDRMDTDEAR